ncbi:pyridine nucleotide-disulfide oxidoreductase domain-containing protein 1-like isoform X2 [Oculina patagonica]
MSSGVSCAFVIIGGGISGVSCAEHLSVLCSNETIALITATDVVKATCNLKQFGKTLEEFDVEERSASSLFKQSRNVIIVQSLVTAFNPQEHSVVTESGKKYFYKKLCICTGGRPNIITQHPCILGIRDTHSVQQLKSRLSKARRVLIVGNGGIALELVYEMRGCQVLWAIKDDAIGNSFFDEGDTSNCSNPTKSLCGGALGPDWSSDLSLCGAFSSQDKAQRQVHVEYKCQVKQLFEPEQFKMYGQKESPLPWTTDSITDCDWPVYIQLSNDKIYGCDLVVSATGVIPSTQPFISCAQFDVAHDGGLSVNSNMQTNIEDVYAAGDVCTACWEPAPYWFQMRLWSQARQMGVFAAKCMFAHFSNEKISLDFCFELFAHVTQFFGYKVILLGKFNSQGLGTDYELLVRCTKGSEYVKIVLDRTGRLCGAVLIGETDLEETFENLILNQMDLSAIKDLLLNPDIDIEDYFD